MGFIDEIVNTYSANQITVNLFLIAVLGILLAIKYGQGKDKTFIEEIKKRFSTKKGRIIKKYYRILWKKSSNLTPEDILDLRGMERYGFREYYYKRGYHEEILEKIEKGDNALIIGNPLSGKTRAVYEILRGLKKYRVSFLNDVETFGGDFIIPPFRRLFGKKRRVIVIDDINNFLRKDKDRFIGVLNDFLREEIIVIATCRSGPEYEEYRDTEFGLVFGDALEIETLSGGEEDLIISEAKVEPPDKFDGNIGSLFMPLAAMKKRYHQSTDIERKVLRSIKRLYNAGVYRGKGDFKIEWLKGISEGVFGIGGVISDINGPLKRLEHKGFVERGEAGVRVEEAYIEYIFEDDRLYIKDFKEMLDIFSNDPDALYLLGDRAYDIGEIDIRKAEYMNLAVEAYEVALRFWTYEESPQDYAKTKNSLGIAYGRLSEVRDKAENIERAIMAYEEALDVYTRDSFPMDYATTQNNLGVAYDELAIVRDKTENLDRAISAYEEALKVRTLERLPINYANTQNNLGGSYWRLSEVKDKAGNLERAIKAYEEALKVYTLDSLPMDYAMTQNNLGVAYDELAKVEDKANNLERAISAYEEALKVRRLDSLPMDYAMTQNNLGGAYGKLSEVRDKSENLNRSIDAFKKALKVSTLESLPIDYAMTQYNIGITYMNLSEIVDRMENLIRARRVFDEALKVYKREGLEAYIEKVEGAIAELNEILGHSKE